MFKSTIGSVLIAGAALLSFVAPVAASTGTVGAHSLTDTMSSPGATAKYVYVNESGGESHWQLHRIVVHPPNMKAVAGKSNQKVGWSFTIQRMECFEPPCPAWQDRYTSPVFMATTSDSANAAFANESVSVRVPSGSPALYSYRTIVKMFWYRPNGSVQGTATTKVQYYKWVRPGGSSHNDDYCPGAVYNWP
jgi:hypothetical protein